MYQIHKSLGQHFLQDENISRKIIQALAFQPGEAVLEVGPGLGALTKHLMALPEIDYRAIEIDREKVVYLLKQYPELKGNVLQGDVLEMALPFSRPFKLIGNFPYQITSGIMFRIMEWKAHVQLVVGMVQKEVARRICSTPGQKTYGLLSVLLQTWFQIEYLFEVSPHCFFPPPRVQSAVIRLMPKPEHPLIADEKQYIKLVKAAFQQRRKMLRNALKELFPPEQLQHPVFNQRAEQLGWADYLQLYEWYIHVNQ
ncbi:dimethyladenosine transferase [Thermoflavifilum aggregans]|uniref:Ribosomal RNA small subunit methyltransferase A n=1 Tax=Thermoflavifilum aggregans TaxID=454188 RepID=A0A2M9CT91_9BACT|nr:16S rRNA (adenine(1518)-N(6)/adenine(1519)-N(6))-dimethyltransferase RsmA [Thermoflavifilum aggregans]PJJ75113.1 dimethyladenosine transferase [Thermoflavifilum aggregans]